MNPASFEVDATRVYEAITQKMSPDSRTIVGIAGPPASGKSTLAEAVVRLLNKDNEASFPVASLMPMDGYHLDNRLLESRGLLSRKGAPETFNAHGFCEAVKRLRSATRDSYHPRFDRQMDLAIANSIVIHPETPVIVVEGNYLLLKSAPWSSLYEIFALTVLVSPPADALHDRLLQRWMDHGLDANAAHLRATKNDMVNAEVVAENSFGADIALTQNYTEFAVRYAY